MSVSLPLQRYPWLRAFDVARDDGQPGSDGRFTQHDLRAWAGREQLDQFSLREVFRLFQIVQSSDEVQYRVRRLAEGVTAATLGQFAEQAQRYIRLYEQRLGNLPLGGADQKEAILLTYALQEQIELHNLTEAITRLGPRLAQESGGIGLEFRCEDERVIVTAVRAEGPAAQAKLQVGDELLAAVVGKGPRVSFAALVRSVRPEAEAETLRANQLDPDEVAREAGFASFPAFLKVTAVQRILHGPLHSSLTLFVRRAGTKSAAEVRLRRSENRLPELLGLPAIATTERTAPNISVWDVEISSE